MEPIRLTVEALSRRDSNLLSSEGALKFLFKKLHSVNTTLAIEMLQEIKKQLGKRRQKTLVSLLKFLQNPTSLYSTVTDTFFEISTKSELIKYARNIMVTFSGSAGEIVDDTLKEDFTLTNNNDEPDALTTLKEDLENEISSCLIHPEPVFVYNK